MSTIQLNQTPHNFSKQNLVTISSKKHGGHDVLKCTICGLTAKTTQLGYAKADPGQSSNKITNCNFDPNKQSLIGKTIIITRCTAQGASFANLTPGSKHQVATPAPGYQNDMSGVWIMGVGEPVKVLNEEFKWDKDDQSVTTLSTSGKAWSRTSVPTTSNVAVSNGIDLSAINQSLVGVSGSISAADVNPQGSRYDQVKALYEGGDKSPSSIAKKLNTHVSYVSTLISKIKNQS